MGRLQFVKRNAGAVGTLHFFLQNGAAGGSLAFNLYPPEADLGLKWYYAFACCIILYNLSVTRSCKCVILLADRSHLWYNPVETEGI